MSDGLAIETSLVRIPAGAAGVLLYGQLSVFTDSYVGIYPFHLRLTAIVRKKIQVILPKMQMAARLQLSTHAPDV